MINRDFIKFLCVGVLNTMVGLSITFLFLNWMGCNYWTSTFIGNSIGAVVSYFLNKNFTFRSDVSNRKAMWKFASVILLCYLVSYAFSYILFKFIVGELIYNDGILTNLTALVGAGIYTLLNYFAQKYFVFKK
ncbi:GtrA family protein [Paenibacillus glacialis]|uniref:Polysaccharide biosynthesis protein GtrA n=1 Tax=Paenibacillus glacialis TaxID=494026 RepID=A0A168LGL9_9BACL|nr:GtrA family protein [Paenibacillus glacialis]OAB43365.1 polysaccharide biosynthesis protein GtrA [Paenibacillus glacialis]